MKSMLHVLSGRSVAPAPVWLMRQAGRYLPEYRDLREKAGSFLNLVYNPELASEVTMQPIRRFGFNGAILFSDILVVPHGMGVDLKFEAGEGPKLKPVTTMEDIQKLNVANETYWPAVYETVTKTRKCLEQDGFQDTNLIGFAGGPWTVACYMVQGSAHDHDFDMVRTRAFGDPVFFTSLIDKITIATISYLKGQIQAGAEIIQIFDSWAGVAGGGLFDQYVLQPTQKIVAAIKQDFPDVPVIGFPRGAGNRLMAYAESTGVNAVQCDYTTNLVQLRRDLGRDIPVQGNLDPLALLAGGDALRIEIDHILKTMQGSPYIFNLGHGILPATPIQHVEQLVKQIRDVT